MGAFFSSSQKGQFFEAVFSFFLSLPGGRPWTLKIKPKHCKGVQNKGPSFSPKIQILSRRNVPRMTSFQDPQNNLPPKPQKTRKRPFQKLLLKKDIEKTIESKSLFPPPPPGPPPGHPPRDPPPGVPGEDSREGASLSITTS